MNLRMGAMTALNLSKASHGLTNPIHPLFTGEQWVTEESMPKHRTAIPILGDQNRFWVVRVSISLQVLLQG